MKKSEIELIEIIVALVLCLGVTALFIVMLCGRAAV